MSALESLAAKGFTQDDLVKMASARLFAQECADEGIGFIAPCLIPLCQTQLTFPLDFASESEQHLRQIIEHLAAGIVNHRQQQRMTSRGDVLP